ncbi:MAG: hypothetical protein PHI68_03610 [Candidatus Cloacimonetes bacterium]|nr:hypothetical protein [Candidatus Cloacimonadota bacterium]
MNLAYDPVEIFSIFLDSSCETDVLNHIYHKFDFKTPGRGTIYSNEVNLIKHHSSSSLNQQVIPSSKGNAYFFKELKGITCIVQRGEGDRIAKISLNTGASLPITTHGTGSGVRDKLGLLRITIPPEKELINLVMSRFDIDSVLELFISEGKLDEPGRGIAYVYPVYQGVVNTKITRKKTEQAASMEQVVSAIDSIKGGMEWRKSRLEQPNVKNRYFLTGLAELTVICNEGYGTYISTTAMEKGAPGATICKLRYRSKKTENDPIPSIREMCKMIVSPQNIPAITQALIDIEAFGDEILGFMYSQPVERAFTYRAKTKQ